MSEQTNIPREKQTYLGLYVTAEQAYRKWMTEPETAKILDVRTLEEFVFVGHPVMAWNIPLFSQTQEWDAAKGQFRMKSTRDFVARVREVARPTDVLMVACRSGGRSAMAVNALADAGFDAVFNIVDGIEGDVVDDPDNVFRGRRLKNGWKNSGLPWTYDLEIQKIRLPKV